MKKIFFIFSCFIATSTWAQNTETELKGILNKQSNSWNKGDLIGFMDDYWKNDSLQFVTQNGVLKGWQNMLAYYQKSYPTIDKMGKLYFDVISVKEISETNAHLIGRWRVQDNESKKEGYFTLLFQKINNRWLIVLDHTS